MEQGEDRSTVTLGHPSDELATRAGLPPAAHARRSAEQLGPQMSQELALATLRTEELESARAMIWVGRLVGGAALLLLPLLGGSAPLRIALAIAIVFALAVGWVVDRRIVKQMALSERMMLVFAFGACPGIFIAVVYFGLYSAVQLFPALSLYYFSRRESLRSALDLYLANAIAQLAFAILVISGAVKDPGLVVPTVSTTVLIVGHILTQIGFLGAFFLGRGSHKASKDAITKMQNAMLAAAHKEALFHEAKQDLDRALALDAPGRFTEHVFGGYRLGNVIGRGGMGEVYEATHVDTAEAAAVKLLALRELGNPQSVERFLREVKAVRALSSKHVVRVYAASEARDEIPFFVMERLRGHDLAHHLRTATLPHDALAEMLEQLSEALAEAWAQGIVHRDLKPQNVFLVEGEPRVWKILDFGVAALDEHSGTLTQGKIVGTPSYMAPEQARGEKVDHKADVFALAAIAYRWLTGRPVVSGKDLHNALYQTVHVMPPQPTSLVAELHADVDAVLAIGLVKDPKDRFASAKELAAALAAAHEGKLSDDLRDRAARLVLRHPWATARG